MSGSSRVEGTVLVLCVAAFSVAMGLRETVNIWIGTTSAAVVSLLLLHKIPERPSIDLRSASPSTVAVGVTIGVAMSVATWVFYPISTEIVPAIEAEVPKLYALLRQPPGPVWAFPLLIIVVTAEELVWRGLAIDLFSKSMSAGRAVLLSSLVYVLPQIAFRSPLLAFVALACGLVWGALRVQTRGLVAPLVAHLVWDLLVFVSFPVE